MGREFAVEVTMESLDMSALRRLWKSGPSRLEGYSRHYRTETPDGDEIELDFHFAREMVRITLNLASENGRQYVSVIKKGVVLQERDFSGNRDADLSWRMAKFKEWFDYFPDNHVLASMGGVYGLPLKSRLHQEFIYESRPWEALKPVRLVDEVRRYLERKRRKEDRVIGIFPRLLRRLPSEALDLALGLSLFALFLSGWLSPARFAFMAGAFGLAAGGLDWLWRQREPFLPKIVLFQGLAAYAIWHEMQMRLWGIFL
ncbi:MAG: hypothetical protein KDK37_10500 [Leptospiraceae bacterium]|nr:hypothetical protein [Leptospiraceae bacterium]MCB1304700.1 hypothetical protein [Leptospiraceae bacterium]